MILDIRHRIGADWVTFAAGIASVNVGEPILMALIHDMGEVARVRLAEISDGLHPIELVPNNVGSDCVLDDIGPVETIFKPVSMASPGRYIMSAWLESPKYAPVAKSIHEFDILVGKFLRVDSFSVAQMGNMGTLVGVSVTNVSLFMVTSGVELLMSEKIILSELEQWGVGESKMFMVMVESVEGEHVVNVMISDNKAAELIWRTTKEFVEQDRVLMEAIVAQEQHTIEEVSTCGT